MTERERRYALQMRVGDGGGAFDAGERTGRADERQFPAQAVRAQRDTKLGGSLQSSVGRRDAG